MQRTVERELARVRLARPHRDAVTNIATAIDQIVRVVQKTPDGQRLDWIVELPADLSAAIDRDDLSEAVGNLIENAARHAKHAISVTGRTEEHLAILTIADDGPGIPGRSTERSPARAVAVSMNAALARASASPSSPIFWNPGAAL